MDQQILEQIKKEIAANRIVLFTKGTTEAPMCGFSARAIAVFTELGRPFKTIDILPDPRIRQTLAEYSNWPTVPQVFINGRFIGGCDIVTEMHQKGDLKSIVEEAFKSQA